MVICDASVMDLSSVKRAYGCQLRSAMWATTCSSGFQVQRRRYRSIQGNGFNTTKRTQRYDMTARVVATCTRPQNPRRARHERRRPGCIRIQSENSVQVSAPACVLTKLVLVSCCIWRQNLVSISGGPARARRMATQRLGIMNAMGQSPSVKF